ncbi:MAG: tandem-95 repeat protein [Acidimicrobiia bacterium]|nr:tandem-95 repeat protein [Acidimicrobiia bacterium]
MRHLLVAGVVGLMLIGPTAAMAQGSGPITQPDTATLAEDTVVVVYPMLNDSDPDGGALELVSVSTTPHGDTRIDGRAVVFTPDENFNGTVQLTYVVRSAGGDASDEITLTVTPVNDPPEAVDDSAQAVSGTETTIDVLANDEDVEGEALSLQSVANPGNGTASISGGSIRYTANEGFAGTDFVTYVVADASGAESQGSVTISVSLPAPTTTTTTTTTTTVAPSTTAIPTTTAAPTTTVATVPPTTVVSPTTIAVEPGTTLVAGPGWDAPQPVSIESGDGNSEGFLATIVRNLRSLYLPLLTLLVVGIAAWLVSQQGRRTLRKHAVVLIGRGETLAVHERPSASSPVIHSFGYNARQVEVVGRTRDGDGTKWLPVATPAGQGFARAANLTEDVARASFEADVVDRDLVREMRRKLSSGATLATSPRGIVDPESFLRDSSLRELGRNSTNKLASLIGDWRASFHIDQSASIAALRPPQLRNFHWISFEAPGLEPWQLFFEYHDGEPYPVAALPETAPVEV